MTHWEACTAVARWFHTLAWCDLAACELSGRVTGKPPPRPPWPRGGWTLDARVAHDAWNRAHREWLDSPSSGGGQLDVLALTLPGHKPKRKARPRIAIAEVKVTRSDLRADLRVGKLLRYEPQGSHLYLAGTREALGEDPLGLLEELGLPRWWGVVVIPEGRWLKCWSVRNPGKNPHAPDVTDDLVGALVRRAAVSLAYRQARSTL